MYQHGLRAEFIVADLSTWTLYRVRPDNEILLSRLLASCTCWFCLTHANTSPDTCQLYLPKGDVSGVYYLLPAMTLAASTIDDDSLDWRLRVIHQRL